MKVLVSGYGGIAKRHIKNLMSLVNVELMVVVRQSEMDLEQEYGVPIFVYQSFEQALEEHIFDLALICSPASEHFKQACMLFQLGVPCFIEKPVCLNSKEAKELLKSYKLNPVPALIGYDLRYTEGYLKVSKILSELRLGTIWRLSVDVGQYLPDWRPNKPYQTCVSAQKKLGGGVLRELSHELDYLVGLFGLKLDDLSVLKRNHSNLEMDCENEVIILSLASIESQFPKVSLNLKMDMLSRKPFRVLKVSGTEGELVWDLIAQQIIVFQAGVEETISTFDSTDQPYLRMLKDFIDRVVNSKCDSGTLKQGIRVMELIEQVEKEGIQIGG
ncbi:oxidoreductase [Pseudoalteromonas sp. NCCP-2140]|uniref:Gfo/Idh/MocA family protein n=1 Tax=Pseudoalteromonas sp. NCCP-2140 TaxID=2942288 RepID=UPI00203D7DE0|nr:Gfo/Idh/MocA family oxidoreductase [Pseudoalteromonas sp. NCCP-2140]GKW51894.1 oxidoreductase [Pseudoalteromonas sp. NCCP-2140]